jgi:hypothetical protein
MNTSSVKTLVRISYALFALAGLFGVAAVISGHSNAFMTGLLALVVGAGIITALLVFAGTTKGIIILSVVVGVIAVLVAIGSLVSGIMFNKFQKSMFS